MKLLVNELIWQVEICFIYVLIHLCKNSEGSKILLWCDQYLSTQRKAQINKIEDCVMINGYITSKSRRAKFWSHREVSWFIFKASSLFCFLLVETIIIYLTFFTSTTSCWHSEIFDYYFCLSCWRQLWAIKKRTWNSKASFAKAWWVLSFMMRFVTIGLLCLIMTEWQGL